jgi:hypothetical protein
MSGRAAKPGMVDREHHAWGALLKYVEVIATAYRYDRYPKSSKTGKKIGRLIRAAQELREQLSHEYGWVATEHLLANTIPGDHKGCANLWEARKAARNSDVYYGKELDSLQSFVCHELEDGPPDQALRFVGVPIEEYRNEQRSLFQHVAEKALLATQVPAQRLPWESTAAAAAPPPLLTIPAAMPAAKTDRHASLQEALLENPDQPQAAFVKLCRVHPYTVRRCRRELEQAGAIPYLEHRHAAE